MPFDKDDLLGGRVIWTGESHGFEILITERDNTIKVRMIGKYDSRDRVLYWKQSRKLWERRNGEQVAEI